MVFIGLYGVLSQVVRQRQREFGLRMALGATRQGIIQLVLLKGMIVIAMGLAGGIVLALGLTRAVVAFLYGVNPLNVLTVSVGAIALFVIGALAASVPAYRAASVAPVKALRDA
jgi:ABC-type antimicrobial peptide transport system permease subunit